jgi:hypothetical protein
MPSVVSRRRLGHHTKMGEMTNRIAMWLHQRDGDQSVRQVAWSDVPDERKDDLTKAAVDLLQTMRRPTLEMRVRGKPLCSAGKEAEVWRAMIDGAVAEKD